MTTELVTIPPGTPLSAVVRLLAERGISGAPVVDAEGRLLGVVTEADLLRRLAAPEDRGPGWLASAFSTAGRQAREFSKLHGRTAEDVMTRGLVTATEDTPVEHIAKALEERAIRRVPVVRDGRLVGLVSRADLMRAVMAPTEELAGDAPDTRIHRAVGRAMREQPWINARYILHDVKDGVVSFHGWCRNEEMKRSLRALAEGVPGVQVRVERTPLPVMAA